MVPGLVIFTPTRAWPPGSTDTRSASSVITGSDTRLSIDADSGLMQALYPAAATCTVGQDPPVPAHLRDGRTPCPVCCCPQGVRQASSRAADTCPLGQPPVPRCP